MRRQFKCRDNCFAVGIGIFISVAYQLKQLHLPDLRFAGCICKKCHAHIHWRNPDVENMPKNMYVWHAPIINYSFHLASFRCPGSEAISTRQRMQSRNRVLEDNARCQQYRSRAWQRWLRRSRDVGCCIHGTWNAHKVCRAYHRWIPHEAPRLHLSRLGSQ